MTSIKINSFSELIEVLNQRKVGENIIFRGQPKSCYSLSPSIARVAIKKSNYNIESLEKSILKKFKERSIPYLDHKPANELEWLALAQHHGLPTRLLDWTTNPLVSIFFAVNKEHDSDGAIFKYHGSHTIQNPDEYDLNRISIKDRKVLRFRPPHITKRIENQAGIFTIHDNLNEEFNSEHLEKITIPKRLKFEFYDRLHKYGIGANFIFPGLESVAMELKDKFCQK